MGICVKRYALALIAATARNVVRTIADSRFPAPKESKFIIQNLK